MLLNSKQLERYLLHNQLRSLEAACLVEFLAWRVFLSEKRVNKMLPIRKLKQQNLKSTSGFERQNPIL